MKRFLLILAVLFVSNVSAQIPAALDSLYATLEKDLLRNQLSTELRDGCQRYCELCPEPEPQHLFRHSMVVAVLAKYAYNERDYDKAVQLGEQVVEMRRASVDCDSVILAEALNEQCVYLLKKRRFDEAVVKAEEAQRLFCEYAGKESAYYAVALSNLAVAYHSRGLDGDLEKAIITTERALTQLERGTPEYAQSINSLAVYYTQAGRLAEACKLGKKGLDLLKKIYGTESIDYARALHNMAGRTAKIGNLNEAVAQEEKARGIYEKNQCFTLEYVRVLMNLATLYAMGENFDEVVGLLPKALDLLEKNGAKGGMDYVRCLGELSAAYNHLGNLEKSNEYIELINSYSATLDIPKNSIAYGHSLRRQGEVFAASGNFSRAIQMEEQAYKAFTDKKNIVEMASSIDLLGNYYSHLNDYKKAAEYAQLALEVIGRHPRELQLKAQILNNLSIYHYVLGDQKKAVQHGTEAVKIYSESGDTLSVAYSKALSNLALGYYADGSPDKAAQLGEAAYSRHADVMGEEHPDNVVLLFNLANYYLGCNDVENTQRSYSKAINLQMKYVRTNFSHFTTQERETFWNAKSYVPNMASTFALHSKGSEAAAADAYNASLFTKGLLLNSETDFRNLLHNSNDPQLLQKYDRIALLRKEINNLLHQDKQSGRQRVHRLEEEISHIEKELVKGCKEYGDFTNNLSVDFEQVKAQLAPEDVAIEFATADAREGGTVYLALCLKKEWDCPKMVRLFDTDHFQKLMFGGRSFSEALKTPEGVDSVYNSVKLGRTFWKPLEAAWGAGVKNIYFSPAGLVYQLGIEYLRTDSVSRISDKYNLYRLSSTKLLAQRDTSAPSSPIQSAAVYGGLIYDMDEASLQPEHDKYSHAPLLADAGAVRSLWSDSLTISDLHTRGMMPLFLPGTLNEAEYVGEQLMQKDIDTQVYLQTEGTEESFKSMGEQKVNLLHIATHGFCLPQHEIEANREKLLFLQEDVAGGDNSLNSSGLLLSGAGFALKGGVLPHGLENGVLTAKEISRLDFRGLQLVVLSACQTGLGEIRDDGVFGLQRGFKKAGAQTLLMSLWNVSDHATEILMTAFYSHLLSGSGKQEAFKAAQRAVRNAGYESPYFWASFIMLDSI